MNELSSHNTGAGKGDKDRSPGWRNNYEEINWNKNNDGFVQVRPGRLRKVYGRRNHAGLEVASGAGITECCCSLTGEVRVCCSCEGPLPGVPPDFDCHGSHGPAV